MSRLMLTPGDLHASTGGNDCALSLVTESMDCPTQRYRRPPVSQSADVVASCSWNHVLACRADATHIFFMGIHSVIAFVLYDVLLQQFFHKLKNTSLVKKTAYQRVNRSLAEVRLLAFHRHTWKRSLSRKQVASHVMYRKKMQKQSVRAQDVLPRVSGGCEHANLDEATTDTLKGSHAFINIMHDEVDVQFIARNRDLSVRKTLTRTRRS